MSNGKNYATMEGVVFLPFATCVYIRVDKSTVLRLHTATKCPILFDLDRTLCFSLYGDRKVPKEIVTFRSSYLSIQKVLSDDEVTLSSKPLKHYLDKVMVSHLLKGTRYEYLLR